MAEIPPGYELIDPSIVVADKISGAQKAYVKPGQSAIGEVKDWMTRTPEPGERSMFGEPEVLAPIGSVVRTVGSILPGSPTEAMVDAALALSTGGGSIAYRGFKVLGLSDFIAKWAARAMPTIIGGATEAQQGGSFASGAATGALSHVFGASIGRIFGGEKSLVGQFFNKIATANNTRLHNRIADNLSPELADRVSKDLPSLAPYLGGIDGVKELVIPKKGSREIGSILDNVEAQIKRTFAKGTFNVPEDAYNLIHGNKLSPTERLSPIRVSISDLVDFRRILKDRTRDLMKKEGTTNLTVALEAGAPTFSAAQVAANQVPANTVRSVDVGKLADEVEDTLKKAIQSNGRLHKKFVTALDDYGKVIDLREALLPQYNKIFPSYPGVNSSTFDPVAFHSTMTKHADTITRDRFPELYRLFEGDTRGVGPRWDKLSFPGRLAGGRSLRLVENIPTVEYLSMPRSMREITFPNAPSTLAGTMKSAATSNLATSTAQSVVPAVNAFTGGNQQSNIPPDVQFFQSLLGK